MQSIKYCLVCGILILAISMLISPSVLGQTYEVNSPYSHIGIGNLNTSAFAVNRALGGFSTAYRYPTNINYGNPASYSAIQLTTLETSVQANLLWLNSSDNTTQRSGTGSLGYLAFGFPAAKFWGLSVGLMPFSTTSYDVSQTVMDNNIGEVDFRFIGGGQLYQAYFGNGFRYKNISAGINVGYVFGTLTKETRSSFPDIPESLSNFRGDTIIAKDFIWNAGLQYSLRLSKDLALTLGISGNTATNVRLERSVRVGRAIIANDNVSLADPVLQIDSEDGTMRLPANYKFGFMLSRKTDWLVGLDVGFSNWSDFRYFGEIDERFVNETKLALGVSFTPDVRSFNKLWKNTNYHFGFRYSTGHLQINNNRIPEFAVSTGLGLPFRKLNSRINLALEVGQRGTTNDQLIRETFMNVTFGLTLNDRWFIKRKFN